MATLVEFIEFLEEVQTLETLVDSESVGEDPTITGDDGFDLLISFFGGDDVIDGGGGTDIPVIIQNACFSLK